MSKLKKIAIGAGLSLGATAACVAVKKIRTAYQLELENCTEETLDVYLGTAAAPDGIVLEKLAPGEKRHVDLTRLPLGDHDVVYIRFPQTERCEGYQRTLIYDTAECDCALHGMIVDYGQGNYDVKLVKVG
ncbi:MAG: hypothetical protein Q4C56_08605 [Peptococcaceae bacterium]|nr:hypothetical protein [Peptococcaceae bacterium]